MNRMFAIKPLCIATAFSSACLAQPTLAHPTNWAVVGAGCVPTGQTASGVGTFNSAGDTGFPAGRIGEIIVTCPVSQSIMTAATLGMTYRDTDGSGNAVRLIAALRQKDRSNGAVSTVLNTQVDSNAFPAVNGYSRQAVQVGPACQRTFAFDHARFAYYVQVNIRKTSTASQALLASVDLSNDLIC